MNDTDGSMLIALMVVWSVLALLFGIAGMAIRTASRTRLAEVLKRRRREERLDPFFKAQEQYARTALAYQQLWIILFVLTVVTWARSSGTGLAILQSPWIAAACSIPWILLIGVGIPAAWARYAGEASLARVLPFLELLRRVSRPVLIAIDGIDEIVRRLVGAPREATDRSEQIELEIMDAVSHGETSGAVDPGEKAMIKSVMVLDETSVGEVMTPRTDMVGIEVNSDYDHIRDLVISDGHSRIPVYEDSMDRIVGVLYAKDLLGIPDPKTFSLRGAMRSATFVPETKDLASLLREFQAARVHIAIVLDEYGGTAGLVTFEDILEELVGEITDEHEEPPTPLINRIDDKTIEIDARVRVEELNEAFELSLPEDEAYDTMGGYIFSKLGRIPAPGECIVEDSVRIEVLQAADRSISKLRLTLSDSVPEEPSSWR